MTVFPKYVFRGTTIGFCGGPSLIRHGYTCTTRHPGKGLLFALECSQFYPEQSVIYFANTNKLDHLKFEGNVLKKIEEEFIWPIAPQDFLNLSAGYISIAQMKEVLGKYGFQVNDTVRIDNLTRLCKEMPDIPDDLIEDIIGEIQLLAKK